MNYRSAIAKTQAYSAYFDFPLNPSEIHLWLISPHLVKFSQIKGILPSLNYKNKNKRNLLEKTTTQKIVHAQKLIKYLKLIPGIKLVALTGSVSARNAKTKDDIDLLVITAPNTLWLIRPLFLLLLSIKFSRRHPGDNNLHVNNLFCPNLWLDTTALTLPKEKQNLYTAHEVLQIMPIFDKENTYRSFVNSNSWTKKYLANAFQSISSPVQKKEVSNNLLYFLLLPLNIILFITQYLYMLPKKTSETATLHTAFFHKASLNNKLQSYLKNKSL